MSYFQKHTDLQNLQELVIKKLNFLRGLRLIVCEDEMSLFSSAANTTTEY